MVVLPENWVPLQSITLSFFSTLLHFELTQTRLRHLGGTFKVLYVWLCDVLNHTSAAVIDRWVSVG